ncbi:MAG: carbohydrate ABC transporter permease [Clostridiales bacterium]|nr:carbohydrate ABC transporter permease [Clostridiales bacterium]
MMYLNKKTILKFILFLILCIAGFTTLYPLIWMAYTSLKTNPEIIMSTFALPKSLHFENYVNAWNTANMDVYFFNSIFVCIASVALTIIVGALAAFILAKFQFRMKKFIYSLFIIGMLIPMQSVLVPLFIQMRTLRLLDNPLSLILTYTAFGLPITIFVLESFIKSFPDSIIEACVMDGGKIKHIFLEMILPMSRPAIATVIILNFLNNWKEFSFALIFMSSDSKKTLPLGLYNFIGAHSSNYAELMAAMMIASVPIIILYLILQEQIINGMTAGAVKG